MDSGLGKGIHLNLEVSISPTLTAENLSVPPFSRFFFAPGKIRVLARSAVWRERRGKFHK